MAQILSRSKLDKLGKRLASESLTEDDRAELQTEIQEWVNVVIELTARVAVSVGPSTDPVGRPKSLESIAAKIRRDKTSLPRMRDVIGCRVVADVSAAGQRTIVEKLIRDLADLNPKLIDRCANPKFGYRALHLEVEISGQLGEIQVRTYLQHQWAEANERIADAFGRGIKYGDPPDTTGLSEDRKVLVTDITDTLGSLSELIVDYETAEEFLESHKRWHRWGKSRQRPKTWISWIRWVLSFPQQLIRLILLIVDEINGTHAKMEKRTSDAKAQLATLLGRIRDLGIKLSSM